MDEENLTETNTSPLMQYLAPILLGAAGGGVAGALPHQAGIRRGAIRGVSAATGAIAGNNLAKMINEQLGLDPTAATGLQILASLGGGYGGYRLSRNLTKTLPEKYFDKGEEIEDQTKMSYVSAGAMDAPSAPTAEAEGGNSVSKEMLAKLLAAGILSSGALFSVPGAIAGTLSPRGSGMLPGAVRGFGFGTGMAAGSAAGGALSDLLFKDNPKAKIIAALLGGLAGGGLGYSGAKKLTKTRREKLEDSMLDYYDRANELGMPFSPNMPGMSPGMLS